MKQTCIMTHFLALPFLEVGVFRTLDSSHKCLRQNWTILVILVTEVGGQMDKMAGWADSSQIQVPTRDFARTWRSGPCLDKAPCLSKHFLASCGNCESKWSGKCLFNRGNRPSSSWINVWTNWAHQPEGQGSFQTKMPKFWKFWDQTFRALYFCNVMCQWCCLVLIWSCIQWHLHQAFDAFWLRVYKALKYVYY